MVAFWKSGCAPGCAKFHHTLVKFIRACRINQFRSERKKQLLTSRSVNCSMLSKNAGQDAVDISVNNGNDLLHTERCDGRCGVVTDPWKLLKFGERCWKLAAKP